MPEPLGEPRVALGKSTFRGAGLSIEVTSSRLTHLAVLGMTGTGKSSLLQNLIRHDLEASRGFALLDPHGDLFEAVSSRSPAGCQVEVLVLDAPTLGSLWRFNPLSDISAEQVPLAVAGLVEVLRKLWSDDWGPRLEHLLRNVLWTLLENPGTTLADIPRLLGDREFRSQLVERVENEVVRDFWQTEFAGYSPAFRAVVTAPVLNKVGAFLSDPRVRRILAAEKSSFDIRKVMDRGGVLLVNLAKGKLGEGPATLLGSLLVSSISLAALSRADTPLAERRPFYVYLDEFHLFATEMLVNMFAELRKFGVSLTVACQYLGQLDPAIRESLLANVGTVCAFRVTPEDARVLLADRGEKLRPEDLTRLPNREFAVRLMINGEPTRMFSARTEDVA